MIQEKPCKGQDLAKDYQGCGKMIQVQYRKFGLGRMCCYNNWLMDTVAGQNYMKRAMNIAKKEQVRKIATIKKVEKEKTKKVKELHEDWSKKLQDKINLISRLIDKGLPCLARNYVPKQMHGGHVYARGGNSTMRYHLHNIHRQSAQSNHFQNDDGMLREGIVKEYGQPYMDYISSLRQMPTLNYSNMDYKEFYHKACKIANELKKLDCEYTLQERIHKRNVINNNLGIYRAEWCFYQ